MIRRPRFKLRTKIIAWSFIPTAIILLVVATTMYFAYQQVTEQLVIKRDEELTRLSASEVSSSFEDSVDRLTALARLPEVYSGSPQVQSLGLNRSSNQLIFFDGGVYVLNNLGQLTAAYPETPGLIGQDWSDRTFFRDMLRLPSTTFSDVETTGPGTGKQIALAVPILGLRNEFRGEVVGMFQLNPDAASSFYGTLVRLRIGRSGTAYLVDGNGVIIYASDAGLIGTQLTNHPTAPLIASGQVGALRTRSLDGRDIVAGAAQVPRTNWTLIVEEDWNALISPSLPYQRFLLLLLALGVVIPAVVVMIGVRRITGPIAVFIDAAQRIAGGDFSRPIHIGTDDELKELADQFNTMARHLQESYETLELRVAQRTQELTALNSIAAIVSRSLNLEQILPDALEKTLEVMGMDAGAVFRLEPSTGVLALATQKGLSDEMVAIIQHMPLEASLTRLAVNLRRPAYRLVADYPPGPLKQIMQKDGWQTAVSIPLLAQENVLGAINVTNRIPIRLSPEDLNVPAAIGQQIGVAIDNARLYNQSVEYAHEMEVERHAAIEARAAAEAANAAKSDFLANVSHELRTPLFSINGFARIVQKRFQERILPLLPSEDARLHRAVSQIEENLEIILVEGQRLTGLINSLLDLEKIESGRMEWESQPVQMETVIHQAAAATRSLFHGSLSLRLDLPQRLPLVQGDPEKLQQVIINLISNAVKFMTEGMVTVQAVQIDHELVTCVSDQGIGIHPSDQGKIFEKFVQVGETLTGKPKGTGLGLAICKQIVEHHGGRIWVESVFGEGSTFLFSLPVSNTADGKPGF